MSKRQMEEGKQGGEDERAVANWRLARHVVSMTLHQSATVLSSSSSQSLENMTANCSNSASDSQVWHTDSDPNSSTGKRVTRGIKSTVGQRLFHEMFAKTRTCEFLEKAFS